ncbi:hypothetical protein GN156_03765 [bacterium LRH843]|nr:hypothetical protein [bacterium LRH843]
MKKWFISLAVVPFIVAGGSYEEAWAREAELHGSYVRIMIEQDQMEYEWKYDSPNGYKFEAGEQVMKGKKAKKNVKEMLDILHLGEQSEVTELVSRVKIYHPNMERLDIRYLNEEGRLFTWVWQQ